MPVEIVMKKAAEPASSLLYRCLVPLRVVELNCEMPSDLDKSTVEIGDIIVGMPNKYGGDTLFNATKSQMIDHKMDEYIWCVRAYDVAQIVICNNHALTTIFHRASEPSPVL
jgi:hypothetical protein